MKKLSIYIILLSFVLPSMVFAGVATPKSSGSRNTTSINLSTLNGTVVSLDQKKAEFVLSDDSGFKSTVRTKGADFVYVDKRGNFNDLRKNIRVRVYGRQISRGLVDADLVVIGLSKDSYFPSNSINEIGKIITLRGEVERVDELLGRMYLDSLQGLMEVSVGRESDIRDFGRRRSLSDIRIGSRVTVTGPLQSSRKMSAHTINIGGLDSGRAVIDTALSGTVIKGTGINDKVIVVNTPAGGKRVQVPTGSEVRIDGRISSVHNIKIRDQVQAVGRWSGNAFIASKVNINRSNFSYSGEVLSANSNRLQVKIGSRRQVVYIRSATIKLNGRNVSYRELKLGDQVKIAGEKRGSTIYAQSIEAERKK